MAQGLLRARVSFLKCHCIEVSHTDVWALFGSGRRVFLHRPSVTVDGCMAMMPGTR
jgi:hypothetical protein